ncbi:MAG: hypothetical protein MUF48_21805, partial [Pirellulaceae bacterium]|nr:hypothetical protein [Pirellulaceae bacterium]
MPELRSDAPDAYDESSGAKFVELDHHREHGLRLARHLQERGGQVWLWVPIGCVPTTFAARYPEAMSPASDKIPCFTHPKYQEYVNAFLQELVETYPLDGMFLVRDDNGGVCTCDRCQEYVSTSRTKNAVWEQYLVIYDWLREHEFRGAIAVYPYHDWYYPALDPLLPSDLYVVGHGAGAAVLVRDYRYVGPMGDTWLDNLYANFRVPPSPRMRRLLGDRGSFWIGGAYVGCELPWEAIGYFGWEPTAAANTLRYDWACRELGVERALAFVQMNDVYEELWDLNALYMPPADWMKLDASQRAQVVQRGLDGARQLRSTLKAVTPQVASDQFQRWLGHMELFAPFFEYHLQRLDRFAKVHDAVLSHRAALDTDEGLPPDVRAAVLRDYQAIYDAAEPYAAAMKLAPDGMLSHCRWMTAPYKEWMAGYDQWLDGQLALKQFAGRMDLATDTLQPGHPFTLRITLKNLGICPWVAAAGHRLELLGDAARLGLPAAWDYSGDPLAPGDRRTVELSGTVPAAPGTAHVAVKFLTPYRVPEPFLQAEIELMWE